MSGPRIAITHSDPPEISPRLWSGFQRGDIAYYVGANCGQNFAQVSALARRIFAFEPCESSYRKAVELSHSYSGPSMLPQPDVDVLRLAVSDHDGTTDLAMLPGSYQEDTGQLVTIGTPAMEWSPANWGDPSVVTPVRVPCKTLDTLSDALGEPDFLTVDTEGHEWLVLCGAGRLLTTHRPSWLIEFHSQSNYDNIVKVLSSHRYRVETVRHPHYPPRSPLWLNHGWIKAFPTPG